MIPNLGKHQAPEPVEGQLTVTNPVAEKNEGMGMTLPFELISKILNHFSLNGWRLMNQLSKPFACYMEHSWKMLSKQEGLYFGWPGCPLDAQSKQDLPYPEQTRYFQGKLLQDYFCSPAFSKSIWLDPHAERVTFISCGEDSLEICPSSRGLIDVEKRLIQNNFKQKKVHFCRMNELAQKEQKTLCSLYYFPIKSEIKKQLEKQTKNLYNVYQSLKKRMIAFPSIGAYIWADLTHLARMTPKSDFPLEDNSLFESNEINSEDQAGNHLLNGLSCLTKFFKEIICFYSLTEGSVNVNEPTVPHTFFLLYLLKSPHLQASFHESSLTNLSRAIFQGATLASELAFKILNRGYFSFYRRGWHFYDLHISQFILAYAPLSFHSADQSDQRGLVESLKFYKTIYTNQLRIFLVSWYQNSYFYPDLLFSLARLSDSPDGKKRKALLKEDFRGYGPNLSQELKTLIIEGWEALEGPNLSEESKLLLREKEEKVRALIKQGMSFAGHNVWYRRASLLLTKINKALQPDMLLKKIDKALQQDMSRKDMVLKKLNKILQQAREEQGIETEEGEELLFTLAIKENIGQISTSSCKLIEPDLFQANLLIKTAIESFENNHLPVPGEVLAVAAILKWYQQDPNSAKTYMDQLFDT